MPFYYQKWWNASCLYCLSFKTLIGYRDFFSLLPFCTLSPVFISDIFTSFPFSRVTLAADGKQVASLAFWQWSGLGLVKKHRLFQVFNQHINASSQYVSLQSRSCRNTGFSKFAAFECLIYIKRLKSDKYSTNNILK